MHLTAITALFGIISLATAEVGNQLIINNWCTQDLYIYQSNEGSCSYSSNGVCFDTHNTAPYIVLAGDTPSSGSLIYFSWISSPKWSTLSTKLSISPGRDLKHGYAEFSYGLQPGGGTMRWGLTDTNSLFKGYNTKVTPSGPWG
ncbi:hypothetical protein IFR05_014770 [Cadophora sp. M221]|nr:hypothetical protein IFR05_014770 [Cadophora sp. M221]